ncbi:gamma-glutamyl-gamma-aminobutyrate hydrolase family protein, partial [Enterococcus faecium]
FYGQQLETEEDYSYLARDEFELALIDEALVQKKPIFAVCRGMQLVNVAFGGDLQQKIDETKGIRHMQAPIPRAVPTHGIQTLDQSMIQSLYGT